MKVDNGILVGAAQVPSENKDERPSGEISLIVLHGISLPEGQFGGPYIKQLFCNTLNCKEHSDFVDLDGLRVSSHLLIHRDGEVEQFVSFLDRAWHAGESTYHGRTNCNDFSIGIELEGCDDEEFEKEQYHSLSRLINFLSTDLKINKQNIVGHADIAPGRKTDPGPLFDWTLLQSML